MKNLKVCLEQKRSLNLQSNEEQLLFSVFDELQNRMYFASTANVIYSINLSSVQDKQWIINLGLELEGSLQPGDLITGFEYLMEHEALIVGTSLGGLFLVSPSSSNVDVVGDVKGGVKAIASSPDGALIAIATGLGQLLVMTQDWDLLYELSYDLDGDLQSLSSSIGDGTSNSVNHEGQVQISWRGDGKFFATLGKMRNNEGFQKIRVWERDSGSLHSSSEPKDFIETTMDWMPSGVKIGAAYKSKNNSGASVTFIERNGLERGSLLIDGSEQAEIEMLKWNCNSELLAILLRHEQWVAVQIWSFSNYHWYLKQEWRYSSKSKVKISWDPEKPMHIICWTADGLVHSLSLCWNSAVCAESTALVIDNMKILVTPLSFVLMPPPLSFFSLKFCSAVQSVAFTTRKQEILLAASLSNGDLSVVKFPDMGGWDQFEGITYESLSVDSHELDMDFGSFRNLTWLDSNVLLGVFHWQMDEAQFFANNIPGFKEKYHLLGESKGVNVLLEIELDQSSNITEVGSLSSSGWFVKSYTHTILENSVIAIIANPLAERSAFIELTNGDVVLYNSQEEINLAPAELYKEKLLHMKSFTSYCPWMQAVPVLDNGKLKSLVFGLDENGRLQVNGKTICNDCTSFSFYSSYAGKAQEVITHVIFTTKNDLLFVTEVNMILHEGNDYDSHISRAALTDVKGKVHSKKKATKQENRDVLKVWERGAKLIGVIDGDAAAVILQTVRGNLETIYPRKLVLLAIAGAMIEKRFKDAISLVRQHRIDHNILVDYCGLSNFQKISREFVKQINNLSHITEFVCALKQENVMYTLYKGISLPAYINDTEENFAKTFLNQADVEPSNNIVVEGFSPNMHNKVQPVLDSVRRALEEEVPKSSARELCILTTFARSDPPSLEEALKIVKKLREDEILSTMKNGSANRKEAKLSADEAVKHLLWLSDADAVFQVALGLYDLHLAAIVALNSHRDPKEFLPFLQELEEMSPPVMRYTIDCKLHRYESALKNMAAAGDSHFDESLELMKKNPNLFPLGLNLFKHNENRTIILETWGNQLFSEKKFAEAALAYSSTGLVEKALGAFHAGGFWKETLTMAGILKFSTDQLLRLAHELSEELQALGRPAEAAKIALDYCNDALGAVNLLITAREWLEALRISFLTNLGESVISQIKVSAIECANSLILEYEEGIEKVKRYLARYLAVRQKRLLLTSKLQSENTGNEDLNDDLASETSSNLSGMSAYTQGKGSTTTRAPSTVGKGSTARARNRMQRKTHGGKIRAGSPGEEFALVEHLKSMSISAQTQDEVRHLSQALVMLGEEDIARKLQNTLGSYQNRQLVAVKEVEDKQAESSTENQNEMPVDIKGSESSLDKESWKWQVLSCP